MAAYIVAQFDVKDWDKFREYGERTARTIASFGGRFIARGGEMVRLEGPQDTVRIVLMEFSSIEKATAFYQSPDYTATRKLREGCAVAKFVAIDGFSPSAWSAAVAESEALA